MPTYDYHCDACGRTYEVQQRISEPALVRCQYCEGTVRRLIAPAPFILKGSGWYVTDYPSESRKKALEAEKKSASGSAAGTDGAAKTPAGSTDGAGKATATTGSPASSTS